MHGILNDAFAWGLEAAFLMPYITTSQGGIKSRVLKKQGTCSNRHCVTVCMAAVPMHSCRTGWHYKCHLNYNGRTSPSVYNVM